MYRVAERVMLERSEHKYYSVAHEAVINPVNSPGGSVLNLIQVPQSVGASGRTGDTIHAESLYVHYKLRWNYSVDKTNISAIDVRVIVFQWKMPHDVTPALQDILTSQITSGYVLTLSPYNPENLKSGFFTILYDRVHSCDPTREAGTLGMVKKKINMRYVRKKLEFQSPTEQVPNNAIYTLVCSAWGANSITANTVVFDSVHRFGYTDG